ncbi:unnamed protein product [Caenorhabditis brenneri]
MSDRFKYAMNGIYKCDNFAEQLEQNRFPEAYIGAIRGHLVCYFKCTLTTKDDQAFLYPSISCGLIINFHCPQFVEQAGKTVSLDTYSGDFFKCLQILHGVQHQLKESNYFSVLKIARSFNLSNVIHYCDRVYFEGWDKYWRIHSLSFEDVANHGLRHILAEKLKNIDWKDVIKIAKELDFKEASGEVMKTFVAKILYN